MFHSSIFPIAFKTFKLLTDDRKTTRKRCIKSSIISWWKKDGNLILQNQIHKFDIFKPLTLTTLWTAKEIWNSLQHNKERNIINSVHIINYFTTYIRIHWFSAARDSFWNFSFPQIMTLTEPDIHPPASHAGINFCQYKAWFQTRTTYFTVLNPLHVLHRCTSVEANSLRELSWATHQC